MGRVWKYTLYTLYPTYTLYLNYPGKWAGGRAGQALRLPGYKVYFTKIRKYSILTIFHEIRYMSDMRRISRTLVALKLVSKFTSLLADSGLLHAIQAVSSLTAARVIKHITTNRTS